MAMDQHNAKPIQGSMIMAMDREQRHDQNKNQDKDGMQMMQSVTTSRRHSSMSGRKEDNSAMEAGMMKQMRKHQDITVREDAMQKEQPGKIKIAVTNLRSTLFSILSGADNVNNTAYRNGDDRGPRG